MNGYNSFMNNKQDISKIIDSKITYKIDDFYDPIKIIKVVNKANKIKLNYLEFLILNKKSNKIEIRSKINSEKYCGNIIINYCEDNHKKYIVSISLISVLLFICLIILPAIALKINNWLMLWISFGFCGLCLIGIMFCLIIWPRPSKIKKKH